ncbi:MAG: hypothetical protein LC634_03535 [Sphingomonadales bacterium]|nr:hypothetical protein [Sphingomonadales bacterium]
MNDENEQIVQKFESWLDAFCTDLRIRLTEYETEYDWDRKRNKAAAYIGCIAVHLRELPHIKGTDAMVPIKDLIVFIQALESGSGHPWAKARNFGGTNAETAAETEVRVWVVMGVWSLLEGGYRKTDAYRYLAKALHESGRKKSWRTVQRWWRAYESKSDPRLEIVDHHIQDYWAKMPCPHGFHMYQCKISSDGRCREWRAVAEQFASRALSIANFRDWFASPSLNEPGS